MASNSLPPIMFTDAFQAAFEDVLLDYWRDDHFDYGVPYWIYGWLSTELENKSMGNFTSSQLWNYFTILRQRYNDFIFIRQQPWYDWDSVTNVARTSLSFSNWKKFSSMFPCVKPYRSRGLQMYFTLANVFRYEAPIQPCPSSVLATHDSNSNSEVSSIDSSPFPPTQTSSNHYPFMYIPFEPLSQFHNQKHDFNPDMVKGPLSSANSNSSSNWFLSHSPVV